MMNTRKIPAGEFKAKCLKLMDEVQATGEEIVITKHGEPVAKLAPVAEEKPSLVESLGKLKGSLVITGDIVSPALEEGWEEEMLDNWDKLTADVEKADKRRE